MSAYVKLSNAFFEAAAMRVRALQALQVVEELHGLLVAHLRGPLQGLDGQVLVHALQALHVAEAKLVQRLNESH